MSHLAQQQQQHHWHATSAPQSYSWPHHPAAIEMNPRDHHSHHHHRPPPFSERPFPPPPPPPASYQPSFSSSQPYSHVRRESQSELPPMNYPMVYMTGPNGTYTRALKFPPVSQFDPPSPRVHRSSSVSSEPNHQHPAHHSSELSHLASEQHDPKSQRSIQSSKRAAQNRAAQRAFRQRKDRYIKDLEVQAAEYLSTKAELATVKVERDDLLETVRGLREEIDHLKRSSRPPSEGEGSNPPRQLTLPSPPKSVSNAMSPLPSPPTTAQSPPLGKRFQQKVEAERVMDDLCELLVTRASRPDLQSGKLQVVEGKK